MQPERAYDVWLEELHGDAGEPPEEGLSRVFGISRDKALQFLARIPRIVKHDASPQQARQLGDALRAIGGRVRLEPAGTTPRRSVRPSAPASPASVRASAAPGPWQAPAPMSSHGPGPAHAHGPSLRAAPASGPPTSADTVKQGTSDVLAPASIAPPRAPSWQSEPAALAHPLPMESPRPPHAAPPLPTPLPEYVSIPAPMAPAPLLPAVVAAPALDLGLPAHDRPVQARHPLELRGPGRVGSDRPQDWAHVGAAGEHAFALDRHVLSHAGALNLPTSDRPPAPSGMRAASERRPDPRRRAPSAAQVQVRAAPSSHNPVAVVLDIFKQAERSSWQVALHGHPVAGFILVLGTATTIALLLYALVRF